MSTENNFVLSTQWFYLKDLKKLYVDRLKFLGVTSEVANNVNVARLKQEILRESPCLCKNFNRRK